MDNSLGTYLSKGVDASVTKTLSDVDGAIKKKEGFYQDAKNVMLNLHTSDSEISLFIAKSFENENLTPGQRQMLEDLLQRRTKMESAFSNIISLLAQTAKQVIGNMKN